MRRAVLLIAAGSRRLAQCMPHSMERFDGGRQADVGADVFLAQSVVPRCRPPAATC